MLEFTLAANNADCMCGDIVFCSDDATNDNAYREVSSSTSTSELYSSTTILLSSDFTLGSWSNASYNSKKSSNKRIVLLLLVVAITDIVLVISQLTLKGMSVTKLLFMLLVGKGILLQI